MKPYLSEQGIQYGFAIMGHTLYLFYADISFIIPFLQDSCCKCLNGPSWHVLSLFVPFPFLQSNGKNLEMEAKWK